MPLLLHHPACQAKSVLPRACMQAWQVHLAASQCVACSPRVCAVAETGSIPPGNAPGQTLWQQRK